MIAGSGLTYAEWAPLGPLVDSGLIRACAFFLTTEAFRLPACDILKQISHRRQDKVGCDPMSSQCCQLHVATIRLLTWTEALHVISVHQH